MALILKDRVKETTTVTSTGTATLLGASTGYQSFSVIGTGNTCYYTIAAQTTNEWEVGLGTYTSPDQLSRDTVLSSSNSGSLVNFSAGTKDVFISQPAEEAVYVSNATGKVEAFGNGANTITFTNINTTNLTANTVTLTAGTITTNAANNTDIVNKQYVDGVAAAGVHYHEPVLVESPIALNALYNQPGGAGNGVGATLTNNGSNAALVIDGVTLSNTARVLVYQQSNAVQNGFYTVTNEGAPDTPGPGVKWVLTRATDADTYVVASSAGLSEGSTVFVQSGDTGAGEVYTCNTPGTIIFGTTNITFAQIGSAQIYSAGTGLSLTNTTFSISNTAVTAAQYGNDGAVGQFTVNAQGQITNAANVSINASSISVGTLDNARTTAASANGASTIVLRDSTGSFNANVVTATTVNATTGNFTNITANAAGLTDINASNITSGTISNARTTASDANSASTIVSRDANGAFSAGNVTAANFIGAGTTITSINASNISSGTIANARTTASSSNGASTIVQRDSGGNFAAATVTAAVIGDLSGGSNINASNIASGTIANARTTASSSNGASTIVLRGASGEFAAGAITGASFSGNGSAITAINATAITTGTLDNARTSAASANGASTIVARDAGGNFSANTITATTFSGAMSGNGAALTNINASNISSGTIANARTTAATANGASTIVLRGTSGEFTAGAITGVTLTASGGRSLFTAVSEPFAVGSRFSAAGGYVYFGATDATATPGVQLSFSTGAAALSINTSGVVTGTSFSGAGTGLTGTASSLTVGTATNQSGGTVNATTGSFSGLLTGASSASTDVNTANDTGSFSARGNASTIASMSFHRTGAYAINMGVGTDNVFRIGGWSASNNCFQLTSVGAGTFLSTCTATSFSGAGTGLTGTASSLTVGAATNATNATNLSGGTVSATTISASGGITATSGAPFFLNATTVSANFTVPASFNAVSAGPISINTGVTVTVSTGSSWVVV
jgi:trimeric autotransporter adhesin